MQTPSDGTSVDDAASLKEAKGDPSLQGIAFPVADGLEKTVLGDESPTVNPEDEQVQYPSGGKLFLLA